MKRIKTAVVGASGYIGEQLLALLADHQGVDLVCLTSRQYAGKPVGEVYPRFLGRPGLEGRAFDKPEVAAIVESGAEFVFLALPHGLASEFAGPLLQAGLRVLDLSADFRTRDPAVYEEFYKEPHPAPELLKEAVYGLPERHRAAVVNAQLVACPGCYPTSILIPLLPVIAHAEPGSVVINSMSGVSGAGRKAETPYLFVECAESARPYGVPKHRHLSEIEQELALAAGHPFPVVFSPHLIPVTRGIVTTISLRFEEAAFDAAACLREAYGMEPFVRLLEGDALPDIKNIARTNRIDVACREDRRTGRWLLCGALDNLVKGAGGQAVQCFNLMAGLPEKSCLA